ncbi:MAG: zinc-ribbon domain-containing protein [Candidatus Paceibacterota bacterium]
MHCGNCGNTVAEDSKFCSSCGAEVELSEIATDKTVTATKEVEKSSVLNSITSIVFFIAAFALGKFLGLVVFLFIAAWAVGEWFPKWYMEREKVNVTLVKWIVWSNSLTWLLPPLGVMTGFAALKFSDYFPGASRKYKIIAIVALIASILNAISGILMNL